jgi:hypothetical protein
MDTSQETLVLGLSPDAAAAAAGVSRTRIFEALRFGTLAAKKIGKATVIETDELRRWIRSLPTWGPETKSPAPRNRRPTGDAA